MKNLIEFLDELDNNKIYYRLNKVRDSILVEIAVPGERWEVEFFANGDVQVEKFISTNEISDETALEALFHDFSD